MSSTQAHRHSPVLGVFLKLTSVVLLSSMAACVKYLGSAIPSGETIFVRGVISVVVLAIIAWRVEGLGLLKTSNLRSHALRSLCGTASMFCWFYALTLIPLAEPWHVPPPEVEAVSVIESPVADGTPPSRKWIPRLWATDTLPGFGWLRRVTGAPALLRRE